MGSSTTIPTPAASPRFLEIFLRHAPTNGAMTFARFMELALYDPAVGYYRRDRPRVGYGPGTDFFTASTSGPIFGELVAAACVALLDGRDPRDFTFVEIGVEPAADTPAACADGVLAGVNHPFGKTRTLRLGDSPALAGPCIVFSNELFDAQPFRRFVFRRDAWREIGVRLQGAALAFTEMDCSDTAGDLGALTFLPPSDGYVFDAPLAATALATELARQPWTGLFVACDYGKSFRELAEVTPAGTARAYSRHTQSNDLLAQPGEQDLTCHVCWDWLTDALAHAGFAAPIIESQEAFFIHHAADFIARVAAADAAHFSQRKLALLQLLHPAHLGQKFQVLHAFRS